MTIPFDGLMQFKLPRHCEQKTSDSRNPNYQHVEPTKEDTIFYKIIRINVYSAARQKLQTFGSGVEEDFFFIAMKVFQQPYSHKIFFFQLIYQGTDLFNIFSSLFSSCFMQSEPKKKRLGSIERRGPCTGHSHTESWTQIMDHIVPHSSSVKRTFMLS